MSTSEPVARPTDSRYALLLIVMALAGCSAHPQQTDTGTAVTDGGGAAEVQEIALKDGTRCAVLIGYQKGALTCNWGQR